MSAAHADKKNTATIICDILNHSEENFVIEIKQISWYCPDPIFFKNEYPNPILIRKNRKYPAGYPILILAMLTSVSYPHKEFLKPAPHPHHVQPVPAPQQVQPARIAVWVPAPAP